MSAPRRALPPRPPALRPRAPRGRSPWSGDRWRPPLSQALEEKDSLPDSNLIARFHRPLHPLCQAHERSQSPRDVAQDRPLCRWGDLAVAKGETFVGGERKVAIQSTDANGLSRKSGASG